MVSGIIKDNEKYCFFFSCAPQVMYKKKKKSGLLLYDYSPQHIRRPKNPCKRGLIFTRQNQYFLPLMSKKKPLNSKYVDAEG
jgi:hypothetical protein